MIHPKLLFVSVSLVIVGVFMFIFNATMLVKEIGVVEHIPIVEVEQTANRELIHKGMDEEKQPLYTQIPKEGEQIGELRIDSINTAIPIFYGTDDATLKKGVGQVVGTALIGEENNSVLSGHRDTVFRNLGKVQIGDIVTVKNSIGMFSYKVRKIRIVEEGDHTVIVPKRTSTLTLTTCYPFSYIGPAKQRYIVIADLIGT